MTNFNVSKGWVPRVINISGENNALGSARIINSEGQALFKGIEYPSYSVSNRLGITDNDGDNYKLVKLEGKEPEVNKLYYLSDVDDDCYMYSEDINNYGVCLGDGLFCRWSDEETFGNYFEVVIDRYDGPEFVFYEVVKND
jgi:hypothetical protein